MKANVMCFTKQGRELAEHLRTCCSEEIGMLYCKSQHYTASKTQIVCWQDSLQDWVQIQMNEQTPILFIGSCGIAVRSIAPYLKHKLYDAPVLVLDEGGKFVIPILAGHYGGANHLATTIAAQIGATAVITTATDVNQLFAVDVFARLNDLVLSDPQGIKRISALLLEKRQITAAIDIPYSGTIPPELQIVGHGEIAQLCISAYLQKQQPLLQLYPKVFVLGIGCRKGKSQDEIEAFVTQQLQEQNIARQAIAGIASIDLKQSEPGLVAFTSSWKLPFVTFSKEQLQAISGAVSSSVFVQKQVGVDTVCERAALALAGDGSKLVLQKQMQTGMTLAIAQKKGCVVFE